MAVINVLPKSIAELIAAGEVVERPASVVKELVENSIDAHAGNITVEIRSGGVRYIRVTDDGCGIAREDVRTAFISHATSKISKETDLDAIFTLGFRGEALPSIASVSRLSMLTYDGKGEFGTAIDIEGGQETFFDDAGCAKGTTVIIKDLFFNTPARMKFLKRDVTEGTYVTETVTRLALSHPGIRFTLIRDSKKVISTPGNGKLADAIYSVLGKDVADSLIECNYNYNNIEVSGFISKPLFNRPNRNMQYMFVNGRFVRIPAAAPALDEAYKNSIMVGKFPMCVLFLGITPGSIDVNVHPAKTEIRFSDERSVFEAVYYSAKSALLKGDKARPEVKLTDNRGILAPPTPTGVQMRMENSVTPVSAPRKPLTETVYADSASVSEKTAFSDLNKVRPSAAQTPPQAKNDAEILSGGGVFRDTSSVFSQGFYNNKPSIDIAYTPPVTVEKQTAVPSASPEKTVRDISVTDAPPAPSPEKEPVSFSVVGEAFQTYVIAEAGDRLLIIDKHAAHERMIFNSLKDADGGVNSQLLLAPVRVSLPKRDYAAVTDNLQIFEKAGFGVEDFGTDSVIVRSCPTLLAGEDIPSLIREMAGELSSGNLLPVPEKLDRIYHTIACRRAIKAGSSMSEKEMRLMVERLLGDDPVMYCPHGRPVMFELKKSEMEKKFGRIQ